MRVWSKLVGQWTKALEGDQSVVRRTELASVGGIEVGNERRPINKVSSCQRRAVVDETKVGWCAALGGEVCERRQAASVDVEGKRVDGSSVCLVRCVYGGAEFRGICEPCGARTRLKLGDEGEGWWRYRELKRAD